jgi:hypothetical protein
MARINDNDLCSLDRLRFRHCCDDAAASCHKEYRDHSYNKVQLPEAMDILFHRTHPKKVYALPCSGRM